ncbi:MAG: conjugal transfer protein TraH [Proteobacteria bacterium]|nr:conjugal transfer protein TraH [Pseudomonadota bacterium]MBU1649879.1 conjugal transfer protein TraH [Pseudomonadota bacterium]
MKKMILALFVSLLCPISAQAGWVDDWLQQSNTTQSGYFEGQQRGYYSAGSFSGRWKSTADYPVTIEPPRMKSGCGGIDVFMGGFSFMDSDYLVDKLQAILSNAAGVAFDLGLKTLCEQCSNTIKNFEALADNLNQMQIDECGAAKELVGVVMDENGVHSAEVMQEKLGTAVKESKLASGVSDMWTTLVSEEKANNGLVQSADVTMVTQGCNADIKAVFFTGNSMLDNVGTKMNIPGPHIDLIRGLVGDLKLSTAANAYKVSYMPPCSENNTDSIKSIANGDIYTKSSGGQCQQVTDGNRDMGAYIRLMLTNIAAKIRTKTAFTAAEQTFMDTNPLSPLPILKSAVGTNTDDATISGLADITASAYSLQMISDLYIRAEMIARKAKEMLEKQSTGTSGGGPENCAAVIFAEHADQDISVMLTKIQQLKEGAKASYIASTSEMNAILGYLEHMQNLESKMNSELTRRYGKDVVARVKD